MKTNMRKKILCIITAITVMFTMSSVSIFALDQPTTEDQNTKTTEQQTQAGGEEQSIVTQEDPAPSPIAIEHFNAASQNGSVVLSWDEVTPDEDYTFPTGEKKYTVTCSDSTITLPGVSGEEGKTDDCNMTVPNLTNLKKYTFTVSAKTIKVDGPDKNYSSTVTAIPSGKLQIVGTESGYNSVKVKWTAGTGTENLTGADFVLKRNGTPVDVSGATLEGSNFVFTDSVASQYVAYNYVSDPSYSYTVEVKDNPESVSPAVSDQPVKRAYIAVTTKMKKSLKSHNSRARLYLPKGSRINTVDYGSGKYRFYDSAGNLFYITRISTKKAGAAYQGSRWGGEYSTAEAQNFINQSGMGSSTGMLVWVSSYMQHAYIFQGSAGNWTLINHWPISTGKASTPSPTGAKKISKKIKKRHGIKYWSCYSSLNALHGVKKNWGSKLGTMQSSGCIRNPNSATGGAQWLYYTCGKGTRVWVH